MTRVCSYETLLLAWHAAAHVHCEQGRIGVAIGDLTLVSHSPPGLVNTDPRTIAVPDSYVNMVSALKKRDVYHCMHGCCI